MAATEELMEVLSPVVANLGVELIDVEHIGAVLRVVVDQDGGVNTNTLAKVNRLISPILDEHDPVADRYTLEVTSPGVERKLTRPTHYERAVGEGVVLKMNPGIEPRRMKGKLVSAEETTLTVEVIEIDGVDQPVETLSVNVHDVLKARTYFDFGPTPKGQQGSKKHVHVPKGKTPKGPGRAKAKKNASRSDVANDKTNKQGSSSDGHSEGETT